MVGSISQSGSARRPLPILTIDALLAAGVQVIDVEEALGDEIVCVEVRKVSKAELGGIGGGRVVSAMTESRPRRCRDVGDSQSHMRILMILNKKI